MGTYSRKVSTFIVRYHCDKCRDVDIELIVDKKNNEEKYEYRCPKCNSLYIFKEKYPHFKYIE